MRVSEKEGFGNERVQEVEGSGNSQNTNQNTNIATNDNDSTIILILIIIIIVGGTGGGTGLSHEGKSSVLSMVNELIDLKKLNKQTLLNALKLTGDTSKS